MICPNGHRFGARTEELLRFEWGAQCSVDLGAARQGVKLMDAACCNDGFRGLF